MRYVCDSHLIWDYLKWVDAKKEEHFQDIEWMQKYRHLLDSRSQDHLQARVESLQDANPSTVGDTKYVDFHPLCTHVLIPSIGVKAEPTFAQSDSLTVPQRARKCETQSHRTLRT